MVSRRELLAGALAAGSAGLLPAIPLDRIRLGVTTDEIDEDPMVASDFLARFGLHAAEVRSLWGKYNTSQPSGKIAEARRIFDAHQVRVTVVDTAFFREQIPADAKALDGEWVLLDAAMDRADALGTKVLRIFSFLRAGVDESRVYDLLSQAARRAGVRGFRLAVENLDGRTVATGGDAARMLKAVPEPNLGLTWDPNNAGMAGEKAFPDGYRQLDPARILHVHLRDYRHTPEGKVEWTAVGAGEFDNLGQIRELLKDGYNGAFTLETHWRDPRGKAYSTETSLKALLRVVEQV
jgi:sugar phosphate isomerase/epimerase